MEERNCHFGISTKSMYEITIVPSIQYQTCKNLIRNEIRNCCAVGAPCGRPLARVTHDAKRMQMFFKKLFKPRPYLSNV